MAIKEAFLNYQTQVETVEGAHIGRVVVNSVMDWDRRAITSQLASTLKRDQRLRSVVSFCLNHNSPSLSKKPFYVERGASAYYTWSPDDRTVAIEWGEISGEEAKLHNYLNKVLDPTKRHASGMTVRSGHISRVMPEGILVCLLDSVYKADDIVDTLNTNGFLTIDGLGEIQYGRRGKKIEGGEYS